MEFNKENKDNQMMGRKAGLVEAGIPRTPFAQVNRQTTHKGDLAGVDLKTKRGLSTPAGKLQAFASQGLLQRQCSGMVTSLSTPLRNKDKQTPLRKQVFQKDDEARHMSNAFEEGTLSFSLPASPIMKLPHPETSNDLLPVTSQSCPEVLSSSLSLPPISDSPPGKPSPPLAASPDAGESYVGTVSSFHSPVANLSLDCKDASYGSEQDPACETESEADVSFHSVRESASGRVDSEDACEPTDWGDTSESQHSEASSSDVFSDEGVSSGTESPEKKLPAGAGTREVEAEVSRTLKVQTELSDTDCFGIVGSVLQDMLLTVVEEFETLAQVGGEASERETISEDSSHSADQAQPPQSRTYIGEYTKFVKSYAQGDSPALASGTSSFTDVTPFSETSLPECNSSSHSCSPEVVLDSLSSFVLDSDDSFSSSVTVQRHLTFQDLDRSTGFVRSSESQFDLREKSPGDVGWQREGTKTPENSPSGYNLPDQGVEFLALPSSTSLLRHAPKIHESRRKSTGSSAGSGSSDSSSGMADSSQASAAQAETLNTASSPVAIVVRDVQTMTIGTEIVSTSLSTIPVLAQEKTSFTERIETEAVRLKTVEARSVALSPMPVAVGEKEMNTDATETTDANTMTCVTTNSIASSPIAIAVREMNTMTTATETAEVGMATEEVQCQDHSVLATMDMDSKTTMTDSTGSRNMATTMTPFKAMAKQGRRLTSEDIRKQHPRTLANQLETLTVSNSRLESELRSARQDCKQLQGELKEAKKSTSTIEAEIAAADSHKMKELKERERQKEKKCGQLEQQSSEQQSKIAALEQELSTLKAESELSAQQQAEALAVLQEKCQMLEQQGIQASKQHEGEVEELKASQESNNYHRQLERAQQMVREREAELSEIRALFTDLQTTAEKQEKVNTAYGEIQSKILLLVNENRALKETVSKRASLTREEGRLELTSLEQDKASLVEEVDSLRLTMNINNSNLAEMEKLYSASSTDLMTATSKVMELNSELFGARKAMQDALLSKEALAKHASELEERLSAVQEDRASVSAALTHTQKQLQQRSAMHEKLQTLSKKMKAIYEDKLENMALGVENLQRTLDNREVDIDNLEKDLYECRNIIVEQRYKIDALESELRQSRSVATHKQEEEEDIEFFKESNAFLEAERSLYVQSIRDLEEKLKVTSLELTQQQQAAEDAEKLAEELQQERVRLQSELSSVHSQLLSMSNELALAEEEQEMRETVAMAAANDLLQHMQIMLASLKKKIGLQDVPELYLEAQPLSLQPPPPPPQPPQQQQQLQPSRSIKSKRHSRKSFVSKILNAAVTTEPGYGGLSATMEEDDMDRVETGSYTDEVLNVSANRGVKEVSVTSSDFMPRASAVDMSRAESRAGNSFRNASSVSVADYIASFTPSQQQSIPSSSRVPKLGLSQASAFTPVHGSSSLPQHSLLHPPSSEPPSSAFAKIRTIPKSKRRSEQPTSYRSPGGRGDGLERGGGGESSLLACMASLKEVFAHIARLASILDRATHLSLQDLREENDMLRERTEILEERMERNSAQLNISCQETVAKDTTITQLQQQLREMREHMMTLTDHKFEIKRLSGQVKRLESQLEREHSEKEMLSAELESLLHRLENTASSSSTEGGAAQARCLREIIALKKKNQQMSSRLEEQRDHYEEVGSKAARRMRVLDDNWKKAEDEVYRLDELVEHITQIADGRSRSSSPNSSLHQIRALIQGESKSSPL
ncbi:early endosome antigen 1-like [Littorina saxatilis]|uniref:early endosome antigen 1-like n=1 Tax=Littorina saxatilis TaxID=31220 RepID=UPI0038B630F1